MSSKLLVCWMMTLLPTPLLVRPTRINASSRYPECPVVPWIAPKPLPHLGDGRNQQNDQLHRHNRDHRCRRRRRVRRRQDTAVAAGHRVTTTTVTGKLLADAFTALTPQQQRQQRRWQQNADNLRKTPLRSPRLRKPDGGASGGRGRALKQSSAAATAGNLDCYKVSNGDRICGGFKNGGRDTK